MKEEKPAPMVIAIDGVAGAGKSTLAAALARALNLEYLDTGAMYRAIALAARRRGVSPADAEGLEAIAALHPRAVVVRPAASGTGTAGGAGGPGWPGRGEPRRRER